MIINEIQYHPVYALDEIGEFLEFFNPSNKCTDLSGWRVRESNGWETRFPNDTVVPAQGYYVLAGGYEQPCGCSFHVDDIFGLNFFLNDEGDTVTLINSDNDIVVQYTYVDGKCPVGSSIIYCAGINQYMCSGDPYPTSDVCDDSDECPDLGSPGVPNTCQ